MPVSSSKARPLLWMTAKHSCPLASASAIRPILDCSPRAKHDSYVRVHSRLQRWQNLLLSSLQCQWSHRQPTCTVSRQVAVYSSASLWLIPIKAEGFIQTGYDKFCICEPNIARCLFLCFCFSVTLHIHLAKCPLKATWFSCIFLVGTKWEM